MNATALLRLSALGDILLCEPVPRWLKERDPGRPVVFVTRERFAEVPGGWPAVDEVVALRDPIDGAELARARRRLVELGVDRRLDLHNVWRSRRLWPWCEARLPKHRLQKWWLVHGWRGWRPADPGPIWRRALALAGCAEAGPGLRPRLVVGGERLAWGAARHVVLVPGAGFATKCWPVEHWEALLALLAGTLPDPILVLGGPAERELGERLARRLPGRVESRCGALDLAGSARAVAEARFVVAGDTGLLHMADAADVPGVALFGPTTRELGFYPTGGSLTVLERPLDCRPCSHVGTRSCPLGHHRCLREILPREVLEACLASELRRRSAGEGTSAC